MDVRIVYLEKEIWTIPYESIPAFILILRENGFPFRWDEKDRKIELRPGLEGKKILMMKETLNRPYSAEIVNDDFFDGIQSFLKSCGASVFRKESQEKDVRSDLSIILAIQEDPTIDKSKLDVFHDLKAINQKWPYVLQEECREAGIHFTSHINAAETEPYMRFLLKVPRFGKPLPKTLIEKFKVIISIGILARLQTNYPFFLLSYLPFHQISLLNQRNTNGNKVISVEKERQEKHDLNLIESTNLIQEQKTDKNLDLTPNKIKEVKKSDAEVFFDYQVVFDSSKDEKILLFGNFYIKNTGTNVLRNPVICFRMTPKGKINFSGQLVPPNIAQTRGVLNSEKGWKFMYDDWFQQAEEKGEIWISPIKYLEILPGQTESFQNFRINFLKNEPQQNLKVEGFVFFQEQGLEYKANNIISLSF